MTVYSKVNQRVSVGSPRNKGPTVLPPVSVDNARPNANSHCLDKSTSWTLNKINYLRAYTYNVRSIAEDHKLDQLLMELDNINWHIVGISETHRMEEQLIQLKVSGHLFYNKGRDDTKRSGVGFLVNKNIAGNIISFNSISDRVAWLKVKLNKRYTLKIVQVYAPTSISSEDDI